MVEQPEWWRILAYYTGWFDWQAIGAIGTMLAVWVALGEVVRSKRREVNAHTRRLRMAAAQLGGAVSYLRTVTRSWPIGDKADLELWFGDKSMVGEARAALSRLGESDFPTLETWRLAVASEVHLAAIQVAVRRIDVDLTKEAAEAEVVTHTNLLDENAFALLKEGYLHPQGGLGRAIYAIKLSRLRAKLRRAGPGKPPTGDDRSS